MVGRIEDTFKVLSHDILRGDEMTGDVETIEFETPQGRTRLERISKPRIVGKTAIGSKRIGSAVNVKYQYSATDRVSAVKASRYDPTSGTWVEIASPGGTHV
jgi:hypothetical protein